MRPTPIRIVPAVDRAARLLDVLARNSRGWGLTELAQEIGIHKGTARDILLTLQHHGLVERDALAGQYRLGLGAARFARAALHQLDLRQVAQPVLQQLCAATSETVLLGVVEGSQVVIADVAEPADGLHMSVSVGQQLPLCAGSFGKVFMAEPGAFEQFLDEDGVLTSFTQQTRTDIDVYAGELLVVRERGYALDDEEYLDGVRAASAIIRDSVGIPVGAVTVVGFKARISLDALERIGESCQAASFEIAERLSAYEESPD